MGLGCTGINWDGGGAMGRHGDGTGRNWGGDWDVLGCTGTYWDGSGDSLGVMYGTGMYWEEGKEHWDVLGWVWGVLRDDVCGTGMYWDILGWGW